MVRRGEERRGEERRGEVGYLCINGHDVKISTPI
jgi:hypothetical protein